MWDWLWISAQDSHQTFWRGEKNQLSWKLCQWYHQSIEGWIHWGQETHIHTQLHSPLLSILVYWFALCISAITPSLFTVQPWELWSLKPAKLYLLVCSVCVCVTLKQLKFCGLKFKCLHTLNASGLIMYVSQADREQCFSLHLIAHNSSIFFS